MEYNYDMQMGYYPNGRIQHKKLTRPNIGCRNCICVYDNGYNYATGNRLGSIEPLSIPSIQPGGTPTPGEPTIVQLSYDYDFGWDGAGNMVRQTDNTKNMEKKLHWDAENRLQGVKDNSYLSLYQYDANGERTYKLTGSYVAQNRNGVWRSYYSLTNATLYASPYLVATAKGYTKHYYAESERIASRIGNGGLNFVDVPIVDSADYTSKLQANSAYFDTVAQNRLNTPIYTTTPFLDTLYYWKTLHGNTEPDCYWYHPDHLGSASWVTDNNGEVVQYLYYLPWGEDFKNQRRNGYSGARHTFSAKEKDAETGYSYFGSRYYSSDLSIWLSVDPMSDKYASLSPYVYCANNPIKLVDPNGEEVTLETIYKKDANGNNTTEVDHYNIKITGKIYNNSGMKINMEKAKNEIVNQIESSFSGTIEENIPVTTTADFVVVGSLMEVSENDHLLMLDNGVNVDNTTFMGHVNDIGGKTAHIDAHLFKGPYDNLFNIGAKTAAHEMGHLLGLKHDDAHGFFNLMQVPRFGTNVTSQQLKSIVQTLQSDKTRLPCLRLLNKKDR